MILKISFRRLISSFVGTPHQLYLALDCSLVTLIEESKFYPGFPQTRYPLLNDVKQITLI